MRKEIVSMNKTDENCCPKQDSSCEKMYSASEVFAMAVETFFKTFVQQPTHGNDGEAHVKPLN